jgi:hypothetical protein
MSRQVQASRERALAVTRALGTSSWSGQLSTRTIGGQVRIRTIRFVEADGTTPAHVEVTSTGGRFTRFRIFNPPTLVPDPAGPITKENRDLLGRTSVRRYRYDPVAAIAAVIASEGGAGRRRRGPMRGPR